MKVMIVIGTRPEAIKMAMVIKELKKKKGFQVQVCVTAQHRAMLDQVLSFFDIRPDYDLDLMEPGQHLNTITARIIQGMDKVYHKAKPDLVMVHGDTNTTFAAALSAFYRNIPVAHVEAGMRTGNLNAPFPEEANRVLTSRIARIHFAPLKSNVQALLHEGIDKKNIVQTGNTVIDSLLYTVKMAKTLSTGKNHGALQEILQAGKKCILVTGHRRENFGKGFQQICLALKHIAEHHPELYIIYPVHLNPHVIGPVNDMLLGVPNILLTEPLPYPDFVYLMNRSYIILTDSGGIQEEAPTLGKPVLVMRSTTERPEAIRAGAVKLVGTHAKKIVKEIDLLLQDKKAYAKMSKAVNPFGDGKAAKYIVTWLSENKKKLLT